MKKIIKLSLIISISCLLANNLIARTISPVNFTKYPLPKDLTSKSRGGDLPDKVAATDGVGTLLLTSITTNKKKIDNSAYNKLLYQNEDKLTDKINLNDLLQSKKIKISNKIMNKINNIKQCNANNGSANLDDKCHNITTKMITLDGITYNSFNDYVSKHTKYCNINGNWEKAGIQSNTPTNCIGNTTDTYYKRITKERCWPGPPVIYSKCSINGVQTPCPKNFVKGKILLKKYLRWNHDCDVLYLYQICEKPIVTCNSFGNNTWYK